MAADLTVLRSRLKDLLNEEKKAVKRLKPLDDTMFLEVFRYLPRWGLKKAVKCSGKWQKLIENDDALNTRVSNEMLTVEDVAGRVQQRLPTMDPCWKEIFEKVKITKVSTTETTADLPPLIKVMKISTPEDEYVRHVRTAKQTPIGTRLVSTHLSTPIGDITVQSKSTEDLTAIESAIKWEEVEMTIRWENVNKVSFSDDGEQKGPRDELEELKIKYNMLMDGTNGRGKPTGILSRGTKYYFINGMRLDTGLQLYMAACWCKKISEGLSLPTDSGFATFLSVLGSKGWPHCWPEICILEIQPCAVRSQAAVVIKSLLTPSLNAPLAVMFLIMINNTAEVLAFNSFDGFAELIESTRDTVRKLDLKRLTLQAVVADLGLEMLEESCVLELQAIDEKTRAEKATTKHG